MMNFKVMQFLVVDSDFNKRGKYTVSGAVIFPIGSLIPIIEKGKGCIGLAEIKSFKIDENGTTAYYKYHETERTNSKAFYDLYLLNSNSNSASEDFYENTDQLIPGAMGFKSGKFSSPSKKRSSSFYDEEDLDW